MVKNSLHNSFLNMCEYHNNMTHHKLPNFLLKPHNGIIKKKFIAKLVIRLSSTNNWLRKVSTNHS